MIIGPLTFLAPLALFGLLALPLIWWILRITPPKPTDQVFPPLRLLMNIKKEEETPRSTPIWLLLYRLFLGALLAIALANPILFKQESETSRPLVLVVDNGWASAGNWPAILSEAERLAKKSVSDNHPMALYTSIDLNNQNTQGFVPASEVLRRLRSLQPTPYTPDRDKLAQSLADVDISGAQVLWLSDGVDYGQTDTLNTALKTSAEQKLYLPSSELSPLLAGETQETANGFRSVWHRIDSASLRTHTIAAYGPQGRVIARAPISFAPGNKTAEAEFDLPAELRNQISQLRAEGYASAGSVTLLDDSWGRPLVGLLKGSDTNTQPLLSEWHFIEKALAPNADIFKGDLDQLIAVAPAMIFMSDRARTDSADLVKYVEDGGLLVRFAGPKLAKRADSLLPVPLRAGGRDLGGALAWEDPQGFAPFPEQSPFFGLSTQEDVRVKKQIMAKPGVETDTHTWARLQDGSPIVTSAPRGLGRIVLFHVTAGPDWSGLPLSGLYVQMLKRILPLARATTSNPQTGSGDWTAARTLNGYGQLGTPPAHARTIANDAFSGTKSGIFHPPGLYRQGLRRQALNTIQDPDNYTALNPSGFTHAAYSGRKPKSLSGILLGLACILLSLDVALSLLASGRLSLPIRQKMRQGTAVLALIMVLAAIPSGDTYAKNSTGNDNTLNDALGLHLAYVVTGDSAIDSMSRAGLEGLTFELNRRTTIEPAGVRAINIETDSVDFYPFLYWPVQRDAKPLSDKASQKLNAYMAAGGTLVFDTQDQDRRKLLGNQTHPGLETISKSLDIPRLAPPPNDHVITKSFYLIQTYPGRWADGKIWVEADQRGSARDGVSSVIVGSNDWAAAWAKDERGRTLAVIEDDMPRQREFAYRFGVNLAMYALSGNYKADQVHAATLVKRLGIGSVQELLDSIEREPPE
ncbi:MAG: hypothetical protein COA69_00565 [Robiginitomaculum sp.]|nr:MAG: hypothetical protein COA69_00565 [Robiginitomaculum sp.]